MDTIALLEQFTNVVDSIYGVYLDSTQGFQLVRKQIDETQQKTIEKFGATQPEFANIEYLDRAAMLYGKGDPSEPDAVLLHRCTQAEFKARNEKGGNNFRFVANVCLVALYQYWEDFFREQIATSLGVAKNDIVSPVMGDIRYFRQSIIDALQVRMYGDAAVANGRVTVKAQSKEGGFNGQYCYTDMYVKRGGRWQAVAEQATLLSQ